MNAMYVTIASSVPFKEAEDTLRLARLGVESIFGPERTEFEVQVTIDHDARRFVIDVSRRVGRTLAMVFVGYARREFGEGAVRMVRAGSPAMGNVTGGLV